MKFQTYFLTHFFGNLHFFSIFFPSVQTILKGKVVLVFNFSSTGSSYQCIESCVGRKIWAFINLKIRSFIIFN